MIVWFDCGMLNYGIDGYIKMKEMLNKNQVFANIMLV